MKRRVYLHAGLHKTGTSSIQVEFTRARHILEPRGYLYPRTGCPEWAPFGQHLLPWSLVRDEELIPSVHGVRPDDLAARRDALWTSLHEEIERSNLPNIVLSSEEFDVLDAQAIRDLARQLSGYEIVPVIFLRSLSELVESAYRTSVVISGFSESIDVFAKHHRTRLDYFQLLTDWHAISTNGRIHVVSYDDEHLRNDSVLTFLRVIGLTADAIEPERLEPQNESVPAFLVEVTRYMRSLGGSEEMIANWLRAASQFPLRPGANNRYTLLPQRLREELNDAYLRELEAISGDAPLASSVLGRLVMPEHQPSAIIHNVRDAFVAMGAEMLPLDQRPISAARD